jgi:TonB family protein
MAERPTPIATPLSVRLRGDSEHRAGSAATSLILHLLAVAFLVFLTEQELPESGTGPLGPPGMGGGGGGGDGTLGRPPMPQMLLFPPSAPRDMRGKSVTVHLVVDAEGIVRQVALRPETGNGRLDDDIRRTALAWRFRPGTDAAGTPVTKPYEVVLTF